MEELKKHIRSFFPFAQKKMGFDRPPKLFLKQDGANAKNALGKTAQYNPADMSITLFTAERHPKDILRSFSHELVHHAQNCRGDFDGGTASEDGYAQTDPHLREMEREAYEQGNLCFRDWEDSIKYGGGEQTMALNEQKLRGAIRKALKRIMEGDDAGLPGLEDAESDEAAEESAEKGGEEGEQFGSTKEGMKYTRDDDEAYVNEQEKEEELEEGGRANRRENENQGEERRMKSSSAMREGKEEKMPLKEWYQHSLFSRLTEHFTRN
jgi:hypothetical protein